MIQKEKYNAKKILTLILSLACVIGMLAGCGRQNTSEGKADGSSLEEQTSDTWYEIDHEAGILTVRLPAEKGRIHLELYHRRHHPVGTAHAGGQ